MFQSHDAFAFGLVVAEDVILRFVERRWGSVGRDRGVGEFAAQASVHLLLQILLGDLPWVPIRRDGHLRHQAPSPRLTVAEKPCLPTVLFRHLCLIITNLCGWKVSCASSSSSSPWSVAYRRRTGEHRLSQRPPPLFGHRGDRRVQVNPPLSEGPHAACEWGPQKINLAYRRGKYPVGSVQISYFISSKLCNKRSPSG